MQNSGPKTSPDEKGIKTVSPSGEMVRDGENGLVVPVGDAKKLEEAVLKMISDGEFRAALARAAAETAAALPGRAEYLQKYKQSWKNCAS